MSQYDLVLSRLFEAGATLLCARQDRDWRGIPKVLADRWRPVANSLVERSDFWFLAEIEWPTPSKDRMLKMAECLVWLHDHLNEFEQRVVIGMVTIPPGETQPIVGRWILARGLRTTEAKLQRHFERAVVAIAQRAWIEAETVAA
jgi:hypothetical protein